MVKFLISRPIAVTMTYLALVVMGFVASQYLPVSLMPDIDIPVITVQLEAENTPAGELEHTVVSSLRRQLMQIAHLKDIKSESKDGLATIVVQLEYGADINFAFIEVNEKIDQTMAYQPRSFKRPKVLKASATDLPVFYLNLSLRNESAQLQSSGLQIPSSEFMELSDFASQVIRKRIEQLDEVAIADISGSVFKELVIIPDLDKLASLDITINEIEGAINANNVNLGNLLIRDGQYQYNVRFESKLLTVRDFENIYLNKNGRLIQLKELASIFIRPQERNGMVTSDGKDALSMAIIKQSDAQMESLQSNLYDLLEHFKTDYPYVEFTITRDQTKLLDYSIANLKQTLVWGAFLAFIIMFLFLKDFKAPWLIGIAIPLSLIVTLLVFHVIDLSLNIISLSGIILGVGMMIDNSIIVIDNITQFRERGLSLSEACIKGTNEVIRPLISSVLTTCAVFIPLIFISGITGPLFYDQAMAVTIGLVASLAVSFTLLPVYYRVMYRKEKNSKMGRWLSKVNVINYGELYEKGLRFTLRKQALSWTLIVLMLASSGLMYYLLPLSLFPELQKDELIVKIDWNEKINAVENRLRTESILTQLDSNIIQQTCLIGRQQYMTGNYKNAETNESVVYLKLSEPGMCASIEKGIRDIIQREHPQALFSFEDAGNLFNQLFDQNQAPLTVKLRASQEMGEREVTLLDSTLQQLRVALPKYVITDIAKEEYILIEADPAMLTLHGIAPSTLHQRLRSALNANEVLQITSNEQFTPVYIGESKKSLMPILEQSIVKNREGQDYPLRVLVKQRRLRGFKEFIAGKEGVYHPVDIETSYREVPSIINTVKQTLKDNAWFEADYEGSYFADSAMVFQLVIILGLSLLLLYFILAAQFESLILPVIVLLEVPIDLFGAFLLLLIFGSGINLMSLIGIVVMSGIIINDSILKLDTIVRLQREGYGVLRSLVIAGERRLKPILMTSLTTILALVPILFTEGLGTELQKPLALAIIGGMIIGTLVSLYFVPLCYYYLKKVITK